MKKITKILMLHFFWLLGMNLSLGQNFKVLQIGDTVPELFYNEVTTLGSAGKLFTESKGKLVILDFSSTYCGTCIESFPKMQAIQDEFKDGIQLFIVNTFEDSLAVAKRMNRPVMQKYCTDLPTIANAKVFQQLFPHKTVPHHVWIDQDGVVQIIGSALNTNSEKIKSFLDGEKVFSLKGPNNSRDANEYINLHSLLGKEKSEQSSFIFTTHNNEYSPELSKAFEGVLDSNKQWSRDTYINHDVLELYRRVFLKSIAPRKNKVIYGDPLLVKSEYWRSYYILEGVDTIKLSSSYIPYLERTDRQYVQSRYSYEQILPTSYNENQRRAYMLVNMNEYFSKELGLEGSLVEREVLCYVLKSKQEDRIVDSPSGMTPMNVALTYLVYQLFSKQRDKYLSFMLDETGLENIDGLELPDIKDGYTFEDMIEALNAFGVSVEQEKRIIQFVLLSGAESKTF